jgi:membrane associated rhomboid family serine protease
LVVFAILCVGKSDFEIAAVMLQFVNWGPAVFYGEWYRIVANLFIHLTWVELLPNLLVLWIIGRTVERELKILLIPLYMVCGCGASLAILVLSPNTFGRGASGAIIGLVGFVLVRVIRNFRSYWMREKQKVLVLFGCSLVNLVGAAFDRSPTDIAHVSGMLLGVVLGVLFQAGYIQTARRRICALAAFTVLLCAMALSLSWQHRYLALKYAAAKYHDQGDYGSALKTIDRFLELDPTDRAGNLISANVHYRMHEYRSAERMVRVAMAKDAQDTYSLYFLGVLEVETGRCEEAALIAQNLLRYYSQYAKDLYTARCPNEKSNLAANLVRPKLTRDPRIWLPEERVMMLFP